VRVVLALLLVLAPQLMAVFQHLTLLFLLVGEAGELAD
jgi:hypothetical protein